MFYKTTRQLQFASLERYHSGCYFIFCPEVNSGNTALQSNKNVWKLMEKEMCMNFSARIKLWTFVGCSLTFWSQQEFEVLNNLNCNRTIFSLTSTTCDYWLNSINTYFLDWLMNRFGYKMSKNCEKCLLQFPTVQDVVFKCPVLSDQHSTHRYSVYNYVKQRKAANSHIWALASKCLAKTKLIIQLLK